MEELVIPKNISSDEEGYKLLLKQLRSLLVKEEPELSNLANLTAAVKQTFKKIIWVGFYLFDGEKLYVGPFQGKVACSIIKMNEGVCGKAASTRETIIVPDVNKFEGHIACDEDSKSEIVVPIIKKDDSLFGVLDLDSAEYDSFNDTDKKNLEEICNFLVDGIIH
ncbi:GAF domain-containing protein [bacterium BMS3Abin03]|nr:GAF domain-containing protein [bacterium BMS3Abin03]MCG6958342.1 GAF domain-containing protein [bacterium BMS3Abin03]